MAYSIRSSGRLAQQARALVSHTRGRRFDSSTAYWKEGPQGPFHFSPLPLPVDFRATEKIAAKA